MRRALNRLDSVHARLLQTVTPLDSKIFSQRPSENEWSVAEIIQHLSLVEERVTKELGAAIARQPQRVGFLRRLIPTSIVSSRLFRVKAPKGVNPIVVPQKDDAIQNFEQARRKLKALCDAHDVSRFKNLIFKHPFLGDIDGVATISFIGYHEHRHYKQIREVLKKISQAD
ncbi:MAG TPA: DinB family protein [Pyrinomonadaceae bacterium]|nr:DinB family protein [Pyrinomonadaceae bacterium]